MCARLLRRLLAVETRRKTDSTQQATECVCLPGVFVTASQYAYHKTATRCLECRFASAIVGPNTDARHARVSDCGPKSPEKEVEYAPVVTKLGVETLPNVELGHAPCTRGVLVEAQLRSARLWRTRGPLSGGVKQCVVYEREQATLLASRQQDSDSLLSVRTLTSHCLGHTRGCRISYVSHAPSIPSPHPVTAAVFSGKQQSSSRLPCIV
jgi:hypothetical protein